MKKTIIIVIIAVALALSVFFLIDFFYEDNIDAVPEAIIEQEESIIDSDKALNKVNTLEATRRLDELKKEGLNFEKEDKKVNTISNIDNLLKRYKHYSIGK